MRTARAPGASAYSVSTASSGSSESCPRATTAAVGPRIGDLDAVVDRLPRKGVAEIAVDLSERVVAAGRRRVDEVAARLGEAERVARRRDDAATTSLSSRKSPTRPSAAAPSRRSAARRHHESARRSRAAAGRLGRGGGRRRFDGRQGQRRSQAAGRGRADCDGGARRRALEGHARPSVVHARRFSKRRRLIGRARSPRGRVRRLAWQRAA